MKKLNKSVVDLSDKIWENCSENGQAIDCEVKLEKWIDLIHKEDYIDFISYNLATNSEFYNYSLLLRIDRLWTDFDRKSLEHIFNNLGSDFSTLYDASRFFGGIFDIDVVDFLKGAEFIPTENRSKVITAFTGRVHFFTRLDRDVIASCQIDLKKFERIGNRLALEGVPLRS